MGDETPEERQENEYAALQAIFGELVEDKRLPSVWKVWRPNDFLLTLYPLHNSAMPDVHCSITLRFICCHNYPDKPPKIEIHKQQGLSKDNSNKLLKELEGIASSKCGEVMIFELAQHVQQYLHDRNKPTLSMYDEMVLKNTEKEKLKQHNIELKEQEERKKIKEEILKRQEMLRCAGKQRNHRTSLSQDDSVDGHGDAPELVYYADENMSPAKRVIRNRPKEVACTCNAKCAHVLRITQKNHKKIYIGSCLGHSSNGATSYLAIEDETGEPLITKKWSIPTTDFQTWNRLLTTLQHELKSMCRLKNTNLVPYVAMETCKEGQSGRTATQSVYIFRNFILGSSLKYLSEKCKNSDMYETLKLIRHVGTGVFSALTELHSADIVHKDVRSENVFLDAFGAVKLVGASLDSWLAETLDGDRYCEKQTRAQDIYATGQLLLSILCQEKSTNEIPPELPSTAKDFFSRCLTEDEHSQWSAEQLMNHGFLVDAPVELITGRKRDNGSSSSDDEDAVKKISSLGINGHSRLADEFEVLSWIGQGAFGDVLKVKNKLDGGFYAIKRIKLNPENVHLNKKITREVKLLSRLNHENVVRYYNAWIESISQPIEGDTPVTCPEKVTRKKPDNLEDVVAKLGQEVKLEWSMCNPSKSTQKTHSSSDSEEEDEDEDEAPLFNMNPEDESSSGIEFVYDSEDKSETIASEPVSESKRPPSVRLNQVLYIQMEFCEKNTLRQAIDNGLYKEHYRAWKLFREIVEGLAHVHQRGMIHRDLKPVNIFLDSNDHVKIGDFGLATKAFSAFDEKVKPEEISGSLTGQVGTALYVAPELYQAGTKGMYNQKVDIYSLGIIMFEMFHPPLATAMERMSILNNIRSKDIMMPEEFLKDENTKQIRVIRWLLSHDASVRPTCAELLSSEHIPRPVHEGTLTGLLSHALSERGSRGYTRLVAACLDQRVSPAEDYTYHNDVRNGNELLAAVKDVVVKVFRSHGAEEFFPPLLTPRAKVWDQHPNAVKLMTASGSVCHLPHDLRLPFARHTAYSGTKYMRRYVVDRVYREKHVLGFHPKEIVESGFDIVMPDNDSLWPDAELLVVASRAASQCSLNVTIQLNHTALLETLLVFCGVPLDKHAEIHPILVDSSLGRITKLQLHTHLTSLCLTSHDVSNLGKLMETDIPVPELKELIGECKLSGKWGRAATQAAHALQAVYRNAQALGCTCPMTVTPFLAYNVAQNNGVFWQMSVVRQTDHKPNIKKRSGDLIAAGGRYDALVQQFWEVARTKIDHENAEFNSSSVGFSMSLDRMAAILKKMDEGLPDVIKNYEPTLICVCVHGTAGSGRDGIAAAKRADLAKQLWALGYGCCAWSAPPADAHEQRGAAAVLWQDDARVRISSWGPGRVTEHKLPFHEVIDFIKQKFTPITHKNREVSTSRSASWSDNDKSNNPNISVTVITADRLAKNSKRFLESQIVTIATTYLVSLGLQPMLGRVRAHALGLSAPAACVRALAAELSQPLHQCDLPRAFQPVIDAFDEYYDVLQETLKELMSITKQSSQSRSSDETQFYVLYSIPDSVCRLIT
ncbi:eIF-2-alpha kinase GCN2 [Amyelois transitella]|uniref:eIF-2-alpha kinase GCN2 n=1 Tax=Amyelois transitella TaxID=680683 RepID=UPI00067B3AB4|nr:eIF-2-alpha kinase GCN2 [Amyelois transitella]